MILHPGSNAYDRTIDGLPPIECHNMYPERIPQELGAEWVLVQVPGEEIFADHAKATDRGMFSSYGVFNGDIFALVGANLYRVDSTGASTSVANNITGNDKAIFTSVRGYIVFTADEKGWVYDGTAVTQITDPDLPAVTSCAAMDGRIIFMEKDTDRIWWSGIFDPANIDDLAFATAETFEDQLVRIVSDHRELWLFGQQTIEIWRPVADFEQPFARVGDMVLEKGTLSPHTIAKADNTLYWVGQDAIVYKAAGAAFQRVSNHGIDRILSRLTEAELKDIYAFSYTDDGHIFYALTIQNQGTYVYDVSTQQWHTRGTTPGTIWGAVDCVDAFSRNYTLSSGDINLLSREILEGEGGNIIPVVSCNIPSHTPQPIERLSMVVGILDAAGAETPDLLSLGFSFSDDAGRTYSAEEDIEVHMNGQYSQRVHLFRQGQLRSPGRVYRIRGRDTGGFARFMFGPVFVNEAMH